MSREKRKRKSFLERAEENVLEHIPEKYQKALVGVYRFGFCMNIVGIIGAIFSLFAIISYFISSAEHTFDNLIISIVIFTASLGIAFLGAFYTKMKLNPPLAFGWAIIAGLISLVLTGFFGFIVVASLLTNLGDVYGQETMIMIQSILLGLTLLPFVILINAIYYLFFAHKNYTKWYKNYAKRHHLGAEAKTTKKKVQKASDDYAEDDL
jgi:hypothetical protein